MPELVITEDRDAVRHVVLNRPEKRNAFNDELITALGVALTEAAEDDTVRCVVIRGEGPMFSSGMDISALAGVGKDPAALQSFRKSIIDIWNLPETMRKPTIAVVRFWRFGDASS